MQVRDFNAVWGAKKATGKNQIERWINIKFIYQYLIKSSKVFESKVS